MQQFTVPQFIDVEDKIIGPVTVRQFLVLMAYSVLAAVEYKFIYFTAWLIIAILELIIFIVIAFVKVNGRPFHFFLLTLIQKFRKPRLRIWNQSIADFGIFESDIKDAGLSQEERNKNSKKNPTISRLTELSLVIDTKGSYRGEKSGNRSRVYGTNTKIKS